MPSDLYVDRVEFQRLMDERLPEGGWIEVMSRDGLPAGYPSLVSTGIMGAFGRAICTGVRPVESDEVPNLYQVMFDFRYQPLLDWEEVRPWTCWTDGRWKRDAGRPDVWRWTTLDELDGEPQDFVASFTAAGSGVTGSTS